MTDPTPSPRCLACGFGLAAHTSGRCPECGTPIDRSLRGDFLANASPDYLARLRHGVTLVVAGTLIGMSWWVATPMLFAYFVQKSILRPQAAEVIAQSIDFASQLVLLAGWWLVSSPNPAVVESAFVDPGADLLLRRMLRYLVIAIALMTGVAFVGAFIPALQSAGLGAVTGSIHIGPNTQFKPLFVAAVVIRTVLLLATLARFAVGLLYLRQLVAKIPNPKLEANLLRQVWLFPVLLTFGWIVVVGPLVGVVLYVASLVRTQRAIGREHARALAERSSA